MRRLLLAAMLLCWPCLPAQAGSELSRLQAQIASEGLDWTATEYDRMFTLGAMDDWPSGATLVADTAWDGPSAMDWRGHFGPVREQGPCGSCYAFASVGVLEALAHIELGLRLDLSEQVMVSCGSEAQGYRNEGCTGGYGSGAAMFLQYEGVPPEWCMPYRACELRCETACTTRKSGAYRMRTQELTGFDVGSNRRALQRGPLYAHFVVMSDFMRYRAGVYEMTANAYSIGMHAVAIVGYQDTPGQYGGGYWIVRNSWGDGWGEQGYFRAGYSQTTNPVFFGVASLRYVDILPPAPPVETWHIPWVRRFADDV